MDWFFGFKLPCYQRPGRTPQPHAHPGNCDDPKPLPELAQGLVGKLFADRSDIFQELFALLREQGLQIVTKIKKDRKPRLLPLMGAVSLRKRAVIESVNDQLKNISQIEHTRHRADTGFLWNFFAAFIAHCHQPKKPSPNLADKPNAITA